MTKTKAVESQEHKRVHVLDACGFVQNSEGTWDRLRAAQPGMLFAYDDSREVWVECDLVLVKDGRAAGVKVEAAKVSAPSKPVEPYPPFEQPKPSPYPTPHPTGPPDKPEHPLPSPPKPEDRPRF
jgi:hypothetical protein